MHAPDKARRSFRLLNFNLDIELRSAAINKFSPECQLFRWSNGRSLDTVWELAKHCAASLDGPMRGAGKHQWNTKHENREWRRKIQIVCGVCVCVRSHKLLAKIRILPIFHSKWQPQSVQITEWTTLAKRNVRNKQQLYWLGNMFTYTPVSCSIKLISKLINSVTSSAVAEIVLLLPFGLVVLFSFLFSPFSQFFPFCREHRTPWVVDFVANATWIHLAVLIHLNRATRPMDSEGDRWWRSVSKRNRFDFFSEFTANWFEAKLLKLNRRMPLSFHLMNESIWKRKLDGNYSFKWKNQTSRHGIELFVNMKYGPLSLH